MAGVIFMQIAVLVANDKRKCHIVNIMMEQQSIEAGDESYLADLRNEARRRKLKANRKKSIEGIGRLGLKVFVALVLAWSLYVLAFAVDISGFLMLDSFYVSVMWVCVGFFFCVLIPLVRIGNPGFSYPIAIVLGKLKYDINDFCRGWLVTGSTGSGKTQFLTLFIILCCRGMKGTKDEEGNYIKSPFGGLCIDEKGLYYHVLTRIFKYVGRERDLMLLQTRPVGARTDWVPPYSMNLLGVEAIPANTYAKAIVDTASSVAGGKEDKGYFKTKAQTNIGAGIMLMREIRKAQVEAEIPEEDLVAPTLENLFMILTSPFDYNAMLERVGLLVEVSSGGVSGGRMRSGNNDKRKIIDYSILDSPALRASLKHFSERYWKVASDELSGIKGTIENYLRYFTEPEVADVFCDVKGTMTMDVLDRGKIVCVSMPQKFAVERRYVQTLLKVLYYQHARFRFDLPEDELKKKNVLILFQDECQKFIQAEDGDVDILREALCTTVLLTQDKTSTYNPLGGKQYAVPILNNLRNRVVFQSASKECSLDSADFIGEHKKVKISRNVNSSGFVTGVSKSDEIKHVILPAELMRLKKFTGVFCHSGGQRSLMYFRPVDYDGSPTSWWKDEAPSKALFLSRIGLSKAFVRVKKPRADFGLS